MLVSQLVFDIAPRLQGQVVKTSLVSAVNAATGVIFNALKGTGSDLVQQDVSLPVAAGGPATLAATFRGLVEDPQISGQPSWLSPLLARDRARVRILADAIPKYYELQGQEIRLYPAPLVNSDLLCLVYSQPTDVTGPESMIPFGGMFDVTYLDAVTLIMLSGLSVVSTREFAAVIDQIKSIASRRHGKKPRRSRGYYY